MDLPNRHMLLGMTLGAVCASALAVTGPGIVIESFADEMVQSVFAPGFDTTKLVKFEGRQYQIQSEDWVSQDPISSQVVKKIEAGRVTYVTIANTATGTYSSDAMFSKNVQYPGIALDEVPPSRNRFSFWSGGQWHGFTSRLGQSFFYIRSGTTRVTQWGDTTCVSGKDYTVC